MVPAMSLGVAGVLVVVLAVALLVVWWQRRSRTAVRIAADPEAALLSSAAALRRLGARITRYDGEQGTLEARVASTSAIVRIRTEEEDDGTTRVRLEGDARAAGVIRRFRRALSA